LHAPGDAKEAAWNAKSDLGVERKVVFADAGGRIVCRAMPSYVARQRSLGPLAVLLAGLAFTALMVGHVVLLIGRAAKVSQLVYLRTRELEDERRLLRVLLDLQERDRKLVAYEIHDGLAQQLAAATYKLQAAEAHRGRDPDAAAKHTAEAADLLAKAMTETRRLIGGLRPPLLDQSGIVAAVEGLIAEVRRDSGQEIEFAYKVEAERWPPPLETAVFRVIQEGLTNACRHSGSPRIRVELEQRADRVHVAVQDWGSGFDQTLVGQDRFGLRGIRERARLMGGAAAIRSVIGHGTRIHAEFPLHPQLDNHFDD
jgi:signal transduction histidine kinase